MACLSLSSIYLSFFFFKKTLFLGGVPSRCRFPTSKLRSDGRVPEILDAPRGRCPISVPADYKASYCDCGCNGPIMQRGMVAWAGGYGHGPDFFIFTGGQAQAVMWKHDHTICMEPHPPRAKPHPLYTLCTCSRQPL